MKQKLLSIVGPTAVGKTSLGLKLAEQLINDNAVAGVDLISADSRQVYQGLEIISGVDVPSKLNAHIYLHGVSMITPDQDWSVAHFQDFARKSIDDAWAAERLPIIVGGTGLYHEHLFTDDDTLHIPPNLSLRSELELLSLEQLTERLVELDADKFASMNHSDQHNPRRLIRAIEVALAKQATQPLIQDSFQPASVLDPQTLTLGLRDEPVFILDRIKQRVIDRFANGAQAEVQHLIDTYSNWQTPAFSATGVKEIRAFLEGKISADECLEHWTLSEFQYAKRQLTWWKKRTGILWYEVGEPDWQAEAEAAVKRWLN